MSRRPAPASANRTAENAQTLKTLVKIESNKTCADCKRNKHPRWASWNLGIFICIRCSGIHRGMGTHISRVKSVDLDSWTDEQTASMVKWGNTRANTYWEAKLASGHVPAEAKIENFIRTKYDTKRWAMDGPIPDPSTLGDESGGVDEVPLRTVQEQVKAAAVAAPPRTTAAISQPPPVSRPAPPVDLFGDDPPAAAPQRPVTTAPVSNKPVPPPKAEPVQPRQAKPADSLLGFDFFGSTQSNPPPRPQSAAAGPTSSGPSRPDLKQSILSLYAKAAPAAAAPPPQANATSPSTQSSSGFGGMNDAFTGLSFGGVPTVQGTNSSSFSSLASPQPQQRPVPAPTTSAAHRPSALSGGSFFDSKPAPKPAQTTTATSKPSYPSTTSAFGDFASSATASWGAPPPAQTSSTNGMNDLFDFSGPTQTQRAPVPAAQSTTTHFDSPFNLSASSKPPQPIQAQQQSMAISDPWASASTSSNAWATSTAQKPISSQPSLPRRRQPSLAGASLTSPTAASDGWGDFASSTAPAQVGGVTADEDFGGWESSTATSAAPAPVQVQAQAQGNSFGAMHATPKPAGGFGGGGGGEGLFDNVWE